MSNKTQFISYGHQSIDEADIQAVVDVLKSDWLTQGPKINEFESALAQYCGARYAVVVQSGTAALHLANLAAGIQKGDQVVTSPFSFVATANSVVFCGGVPRFVDIDSETLNLSIPKLRSFLKKNKVKAIMPVHFSGLPCQMKEIHDLAQHYNCMVIEDACQALGAQYEGAKIGSCQYSDMTVFSFHPVKSITTGEGGAILTNDKKVYQKLLQLRSHGVCKLPKQGLWYYEMRELGYSYRLTDMQAALGFSQLKKIERFIEKRHALAEHYFSKLNQNVNIVLPGHPSDFKMRSSWHLFPVRMKIKNIQALKPDIIKDFHSRGVGVQVHFIPIHLHPYYKKEFGFEKGDFPIAENVYEEILSLPLHVGLERKQIDFVVQTLCQLLEVYH